MSMRIALAAGIAIWATSLAVAQTPPAAGPPAGGQSPSLPRSMDMGDPSLNLEVKTVVPGLHYVEGRNVSSNTYVIDTAAGAVIVDTSRGPAAAAHIKVLGEAGVKSAAYAILTHAHADHIGGAEAWRKTGAKLVAHELFTEFQDYTNRLAGFFARRSAAQFQFGAAGGQSALAQAQQVATARIVPDITFADRMTLDAGDVKLEILHTPGETPDHLTVWDPRLKAAFVGDNFYESFPNMYTLRGTRPRWPTDYITSIETVLSLNPEILAPSHGPPIVGAAEVQKELERYRDAIVHVHDAVVAGMNAGKDVHTLMQEIKLPPELDVGEGYGKISWSVRGIYEGYAGWFSGDPADMYEAGRESVSDDLVKLAGGPRAIAGAASKLTAAGKAVEALHLATIGLEGAPGDKDLLTARLVALEALQKASRNRNELGWLMSGIAAARRDLAK